MNFDPALPRSLGGSIQDRIRAAVEAEIVSGERRPGSLIDDRELSERFQASRTPVREALLVLAAQGLVHIAPRAGIYVRRASIDELVASLEALTEMESVLAGMAARRATAAHCAELRTAVARCTERAAEGDVRGYEAANAVLHQVIYRASGNPVLVDSVRGMRRTLAAYRQCSTRHPGRLGPSADEHRRIVGAICAGDPAAAALEMRQHINLGGEALVALVLAAQTLGAQHDAAGPAEGAVGDPAPVKATRRRAAR